MSARILVLGAGFGGLELCAKLSEGLGENGEVTLIDRGEGFVFGYSKLDLMFRGAGAAEVRLPFADFRKPGVRLLRETVTAIDPEAKRVTTDAGVHEADRLVVALGADYDLGEGRIGSVDIDFLSGPERTGRFNPPSAEQMALKEEFGASRRAQWFGR